MPDETRILRFRRLLETHRLTVGIFEAVKALLTAKRPLLQSGTIVDATIIAALSSMKNAAAAGPHKPLSARWRAINRARSRTRARVSRVCPHDRAEWGAE